MLPDWLFWLIIGHGTGVWLMWLAFLRPLHRLHRTERDALIAIIDTHRAAEGFQYRYREVIDAANPDELSFRMVAKREAPPNE